MSALTEHDARLALLARLIDHAALFPPASLPLPDALVEHARLRASPEAWLVGRFVCPASRVGELGDADVRLTVVVDDPGAPLDDPRIEALELPPAVPDSFGEAGEIYVERPVDELTWLDGAARLGRRAKVRCGGAAVPSVAELGAFVARCRALGLVFKATAGLHHAVRRDGEHGFLNLLAAAVFGHEEEALGETDAAAFAVTAEAFTWRHRSAPAGEVASVRAGLFAGFGSCSVEEPVDELRALRIL